MKIFPSQQKNSNSVPLKTEGANDCETNHSQQGGQKFDRF